jgi:hypothetical protein
LGYNQDATTFQHGLSPENNWLAELHQKLWGKHELYGTIFRSVDLGHRDYDELQSRLASVNPSRHSESVDLKNVLEAKMQFLRGLSISEAEPDSAMILPMAIELDNIEDDETADGLDWLPSDFPSKLHYIDLSFLGLKNSLRVPNLMLIRHEWLTLMDIIQNKENGVKGSVIITGQPGIGKALFTISSLSLC